MNTHALTDENGSFVASVAPADPRTAARVIRTADDPDGRSEWVWVRLASGDLLLGTFPRGGTYEAVEAEATGAA